MSNSIRSVSPLFGLLSITGFHHGLSAPKHYKVQLTSPEAFIETMRNVQNRHPGYDMSVFSDPYDKATVFLAMDPHLKTGEVHLAETLKSFGLTVDHIC